MGSTLATTTHLRRELPTLLRSLCVRSMLDAPCGDFHWLSKTDLSGIAYTGIDSSPNNLAAARAKVLVDGCAPASQLFIKGDIAADILPSADIMLCRDFLQHLPNAKAFSILKRVQGAAPLFLLTSHDAEVNTDIERDGDFRPLNLTAPPFSLPPPLHAIEDPPGSQRILGLWSREALESLGG